MPIFIKFSGLGGEQTQVSLGNTFLKIDDDFQQLADASAGDFLKLEASKHIEHDLTTVGDWFIKLDGDFLKLSDVALKFDALAIKLTNPTPTDAAAVELPAVQLNFLKLDADLKLSAADLGTGGTEFIKLDTAPDLESLKIDEFNLGGDFLKVSTDIANNGADFKIVGDDLTALGTGPNSKELDGALKLLGDQVLKIGSAFDAVALDFQKLGQDFENLSGEGITTVADFLKSQDSSASQSTLTGPLGSDFLKLEQDFQVLNHDIAGGFFDAGPVIGDLFAQSGKDSDHPTMDNIGQFPGGAGILKIGQG